MFPVRRSVSGLLAATGVLLFAFATLASSAGAQEIRLTGNQAFSGIPEVGNPQGTGIGARFFLSSGLGFALDRDRYRSDRTVDRFLCPPGGSGSQCSLEPVRFEFDMDFTTFLVMLELGRSERWAFRLGVGRSAGRIVGEGRGQESGGALVPVQADRGSSALGWSRGVDGTLLVLELLRPIPVPGPIRWDVSTVFRTHQSDMSGCREGEFSPFCGRVGMSELQVGLVVGLRR